MKINKKKSSKRYLITIALVLVLSGLCLATLEKMQITNFIGTPKASEPNLLNQKIDNNPPTAEQKAAGELQKKTASETPTNNDLGISITDINTSADPISIRSVISGAISNNGVCTLSLAQGSVIVTKTADTYALPTSSTCKGFNIAKSELSAGAWQVKLTVVINNKESSVTGNFSLE